MVKTTRKNKMKKKTEKEMKLFLQDSEINVRQASNTKIDVMNVLLGALDSLLHQHAITEETHSYLERQISRIDTQAKKIEIEFYKLKQKIEE